jgi:hypothetical protein
MAALTETLGGGGSGGGGAAAAARLAGHPGLASLLGALGALARQWSAAQALDALDALVRLARAAPGLGLQGGRAWVEGPAAARTRTAHCPPCKPRPQHQRRPGPCSPDAGTPKAGAALQELGQALARGAARLGPAGLLRAAAGFAALGAAPAPLLAEAPLKALLRGDGADAGAAALLEVLLGLAAGGDGGGAAQLPPAAAEAACRALLDALPRLSPPALAAVLAAFPRLGLAGAGGRLLAKLSGEYARRPVVGPDPSLVLAVLRGLEGAAAGPGGDAAARGVTGALLNRLWDDLRPALPGLSAADVVAAAGLLARLGCLSPATPWKAAAADALGAELRARLAPPALRADMFAALPALAAALRRAEPQPGARELAAEAARCVDGALAEAAPAALWRCALALTRLEPAVRDAAFAPPAAAAEGNSGGAGGLDALGARIICALGPRMAEVAAAVGSERGPDAPGSGGGNSSSSGGGGGGHEPALSLEAIVTLVEAWARLRDAAARAGGGGLLAWLDAPPVARAACVPLAAAAHASLDAPQAVVPGAVLDTAGWHALARLLRAAVDVLSASAEEEDGRARRRRRDAADASSDPPAAEQEAVPPAALLAEALALVEALGPAGAAACAPADAASLLWSASVLGGLGLSHWDVLAVALDRPGVAFDEAQLAAVFEAHALVLLRLHGATPLPTPPGELSRCRGAYWARLAPSAGARAALAGALARGGLLPPGAGATAQEQGHLLVVDCVDPGGAGRAAWAGGLGAPSCEWGCVFARPWHQPCLRGSLQLKPLPLILPLDPCAATRRARRVEPRRHAAGRGAPRDARRTAPARVGTGRRRRGRGPRRRPAASRGRTRSRRPRGRGRARRRPLGPARAALGPHRGAARRGQRRRRRAARGAGERHCSGARGGRGAGTDGAAAGHHAADRGHRGAGGRGRGRRRGGGRRPGRRRRRRRD